VNLAALLGALDQLALERRDDGQVVVQTDPPRWCHELGHTEVAAGEAFVLEDCFPVLAAFMVEAERAWDERGTARSEFWTEVTADGREVHLEATAVAVDGARILVVQRNDRLFDEKRFLLQRAREVSMTHETLGKELERRDVLVHAIVHDLATPLHSILGALSLLVEAPLDQERRTWVTAGLGAATRMRALVSQILDAFVSTRQAARTLPEVEVDGLIGEVVQELGPACRRAGVRIERRNEVPGAVVLAERDRLFRVVVNLIDNAMKHSPADTAITLTVRRAAGGVEILVDDEGCGVPQDLVPRLFELLSRGNVKGSVGLGLYYCRISVERWGGRVGYTPRPDGGARFWARFLSTTHGDDRHG